jgi:phosphoserine phosphatase
MHRLAAPEALATLLHEIIEVGKSAIVAEEGVLWLWDGPSGELTIVVPAAGEQGGARSSLALARDCGTSLGIINIPDCRNDDRFKASPVQAGHFEVRSLLNVPVLGRDSSLLGVMQWLGSEPGQFDRHDEWLAPALAAQAAVAIQHSRMTDELLANAILQQEVAVAKEIQMSTLPETMPEVPGYDVHGHFLPTSHTGGDLFDLALLNDRLFMLLGDATGHGFGPALSATQMQAMLRVAFRCGTDLGRAYMHVNNQLNEDLPASSPHSSAFSIRSVTKSSFTPAARGRFSTFTQPTILANGTRQPAFRSASWNSTAQRRRANCRSRRVTYSPSSRMDYTNSRQRTDRSSASRGSRL